MVTINIFAMIFAALILNWMLIRTRCRDSVGWWAFRTLVCYALVCFVYLAYDTNNVGDSIPTHYLFIRLGWVALVVAMAILWQLMKSERKNKNQVDFNTRLNGVFNKGVSND